MTANTFDDKWHETRAIHQQWRGFYQIMGGSSAVVILLVVGGMLFLNQMLDAYTTGLFTEAVGLVGTVLLVDVLIRRRFTQLRDEIISLQHEALRFQLGSTDNSTALVAARTLWDRGALHDSSLEGIDLERANLQRTRLRRARLARANLQDADLSGSFLGHIDLAGADLRRATLAKSVLMNATLSSAMMQFANLEEANLIGADLSGADMGMVNLFGASVGKANLSNALLFDADLTRTELSNTNLVGANLQAAKLDGAQLINANLTGVNLARATFNEDTILPDAVIIGSAGRMIPIYDKHWTPDTDMSRYTNPEHPDFWQPEWARQGFADWSTWRASVS